MKKTWLDPPKKIRKCPHCKSNKGVKMPYSIVGYGWVCQTFSAVEIDSEREMIDQFERHCECLNCGKSIETEAIKQP